MTISNYGHKDILIYRIVGVASEPGSRSLWCNNALLSELRSCWQALAQWLQSGEWSVNNALPMLTKVCTSRRALLWPVNAPAHASCCWPAAAHFNENGQSKDFWRRTQIAVKLIGYHSNVPWATAKRM